MEVVLELHRKSVINRNQIVQPRRNHYISGLAPQEYWHITNDATPK